MRIAYGIHGYGRGHATRAWAALPALARDHEVCVFAGGDAYDTLQHAFAVERIPTLGFAYRGATRSNWLTVRRCAPLIADLIRMGPTTRKVARRLRELAPDVVIYDCEPFTFRAARMLSIPTIAFDHFGMLIRCNLQMPVLDWLESFVDRSVYNMLLGGPTRALVSSFFPAPTRSARINVVGALLRSQVLELEPTEGDHLLAYFNRGASQLTPSLMRALGEVGLEVRLYGANRQGKMGNLTFRPPGDQPFLDDLASCRAIVSTAGNQLVGEAMHLGKPLLVMPERSVEQRMNAAAIARLGIGEWVHAHDFTSDLVRRFLSKRAKYAARALERACDGRQEAVETLQRWIGELGQSKKQRELLREAIA